MADALFQRLPTTKCTLQSIAPFRKQETGTNSLLRHKNRTTASTQVLLEAIAGKGGRAVRCAVVCETQSVK
jgi:hypothetical protein